MVDWCEEQCNNCNKYFLPDCDVHLSETDYQKQNVGRNHWFLTGWRQMQMRDCSKEKDG